MFTFAVSFAEVSTYAVACRRVRSQPVSPGHNVLSNSTRDTDHLGPVSTYMTSCGKDCATFDVKGARWFKIDAAGYDSGSWASTKLIQSMFNGKFTGYGQS